MLWVALGQLYPSTQAIDELLPSLTSFCCVHIPPNSMANLSVLIGQLPGYCRKVYAGVETNKGSKHSIAL